jgi:hypothetical protein
MKPFFLIIIKRMRRRKFLRRNAWAGSESGNSG